MSQPSLEKVFRSEYDALKAAGHDILVEGRFVEINPSAKAVDQVWLGLTRTEFIVSEISGIRRRAQERRNSSGKRDTSLATDDDNRLQLRRTFPVKFIRILIIDDRAKRMAVATSTRNIILYEMCKPKDNWGRWKHAAAKLHQKQVRYRLRKISKAQKSVGDELYSPDSRYISYPLVCRQIADQGVQTDPMPEPPPSTADKPKAELTEDDTLPSLVDQDPGVIPESDIDVDRVGFCRDDGDILLMCRAKRHPDVRSSNSTTCVPPRENLLKNTERSLSCPALWKTPADVDYFKHETGREKHFARRKLTRDDVHIIDEMLQYRTTLKKKMTVTREWTTGFTWDWDDSGALAEFDINRLLEEAQPQLGVREDKGGTKCEECGGAKPHQKPAQQGRSRFNLYEYLSSCEVREFHAGEIAMQLTLRDRNLLWQLTQNDVTRLALCSLPASIRETKSTPLIKMAAWSQRVAQLVATEIMDQPNYESCLETVKLFIKVAEFCWRIRNFNSFINVMQGLQFYPVYRLGLVWEYLRKTEPELLDLYLAMCESVPRLCAARVRLSSRRPAIPWLPALVSKIVHETTHLQFINTGDFRHFKRLTDLTVSLGDLEVVMVRHVGFQTPIEQSVINLAEQLSADILKEAQSEATWQIFDSGSESGVDGPDEGVDPIDARAFEFLNKPPKVVDNSFMGRAKRQVLHMLGDKSDEEEFAPAEVEEEKEPTTLQGRMIKLIKNEPSDSAGRQGPSLIEKTQTNIANAIPTPVKKAQHQIAEAAKDRLRNLPIPDRFKPKLVPEDRELTLLEKLSGQTVPYPKPKKVSEAVKELVRGEEAVEPQPYVRSIVEKDLDDLIREINIEAANQPKDKVHIVANKTRTPKVVKFFGKILPTGKSTKSMGGVPYNPNPTDAELAEMSVPSPAQFDRSRIRYSITDSNVRARNAVTAGTATGDIAKQKSLLASSLAFSEIKNKYRDSNQNANAEVNQGHSGRRRRKGLRRFYFTCAVCLSRNCRYRAEPARYLVEAQLAASKYTFIHNHAVDRFLTRRPVLSDYGLLDSFRRGLL